MMQYGVSTEQLWLIAVDFYLLRFCFQPQIEEIEKSMQIREQQIEEIKLKMNSVEDVVFSRFCQEIGVRNIRQYEDRELRAQEERKQKRLEFQKQINRITSNLEFERSRDTQSKL